MARKNDSPAPGVYEAKKIMGADSPAKSISPKLSVDYKAKNDRLVPGPGTYEFHLRAMKTAPSWQLGTSKRSTNTNPGMKGVSTDPGAYDPRSTFTKQASPNYRMGTEVRKMFDDKRGNPGPGNYPTKSQAFESGKGFAMGAKLKDQRKMQVPGAGSYDPVPEVQKPKGPGYSMGVKLKSDLTKSAWVPGPGQYTGDDAKTKQKAPNYGFGSSVRPEQTNKKFMTPGPGSYRVPMAIGARWESVQ